MILKNKGHIAFFILALAGLSLSACSNTFRGAGQDIENAGEAVQDANN